MPEVSRLQLDQAADFDRWQAYVRSRPDSHGTDLGEWRLLFRDLYGLESHTYLAVDGARTVGALSLYHIPSPFTGKTLVTCPFFGYGGFYWETDAARDALLAEADRLARELCVDFIELRLRQELPAPFESNTDFAEFNLALGREPDWAWTGKLSSNVRQNIRKSRAEELRFRLSADPGPCYELLRRTLRAHGTPFHGRRFFELLTERLGHSVRYSEVWRGERLVAGGVVLQYRDTILTPYIGSLFRYRSLRSNYLQYWSLVEHCCAEGIRNFEMGRSPRGSTHARFKQKWGCDELPLFYNYRVVNPRKRYRSVSRPSATQRLATRVWQRLPLAVTTALGPKLFRYIP